jgi:hypothetical protein
MSGILGESYVKPFRTFALGAFAVAATMAGCTSIIGDYAHGTAGPGGSDATTDQTAEEGGSDSTAPTESGADTASPKEAGSGVDASTGVDAGDASAPTGDSGSLDASDGSTGCSGLLCDGGCVTDPTSDPHNCGGCGIDCTNLPNVTGPASCSSSMCTFPLSSCAPGFTHCTGTTLQGCETNITTATNCGGCGTTCSAQQVCAGSGSTYACASACSGSEMLCGSSCVDTVTDPQHCGSCTNVCQDTVPHSVASCAGSTCGFTCNSGYSTCSGACVDEQTDDNNCGGCTHACSGGTSCSGGSCVCPGGSCLLAGTCVTNNASACQSNSCAACPVPTGGSATCGSGGCTPSCPSGDSLCGTTTTCFDLQTDANNCGTCGHSCGGGTCSAGICQPWTLPITGSPNSVATDGVNVYWSDSVSNALMQTPIAGGAVITLATGVLGINNVHVGGTRVVYAGTSLMGVATVGATGSGGTIYTASGATVIGTAIDPGGQFAYADFATTSTPVTQGIAFCPTIGGSCKTLSAIHAGGAALDAKTAWYRSINSADAYSAPLGATASTTYTGATSYIGQLASDGTHVYYQYESSPNYSIYSTTTAAPSFTGSTPVLVSGLWTWTTDFKNIYTFLVASPYTIASTAITGALTTTITSAGTYGNTVGGASESAAGGYLVFVNTLPSTPTIAAVVVQ